MFSFTLVLVFLTLNVFFQSEIIPEEIGKIKPKKFT